MSKYKTLCELDKKYIEKKLSSITKLVLDPNYICIKCARVAQQKEYLCKPQKLKN
jgi:hypothetical protein